MKQQNQILFRKKISNLYRKYNVYLLKFYPFYKKVKIVLPNITFNIYGIKIFKNYGIGKDFKRNFCHEPICSEYFVGFFRCHPNSVFWDCGSSIGYYSLLAKTVSQNRSFVHAFEKRTIFNRYVNKSIRDFASGNFILNNTVLDTEEKFGHTSLDTYAIENGFPDFIKMDIDGAEINAFRGMKKIFERSTTYLLIEVHFKDDYKTIRQFILDLIPEQNYRLFLGINHRYRESNWLPILSLSELPKKQTSNIFDPDYILLCEPIKKYTVNG